MCEPVGFDPYARASDPSARLAVAAIRDNLGVAAEGELAGALPRDAESWQEALDRALAAGLAAVLYETVAKRELQSQAPAEVLKRLREVAIATSVGESVRMRALSGVVEILEPAGIEMFAIKGAALSVLMPRHGQLRAPCDLDVWVPGSAAEDASRLLREHGYPLRDGERPEDRRKCHCPPLRSPGDGTVIEVHRRAWLCPREQDSGPPRYTRLAHEQLALPVAVPAVEQLTVIQAAHAAVGETAPGHLRTVWDVAALARLGPTEWSQVAELAARIGSLRGVKAILSRVALLGLAEVPKQLRMSPRAEARVRVGSADSFQPKSTLRKIWRRCAALDGPGDWLRTGLLALRLR